MRLVGLVLGLGAAVVGGLGLVVHHGLPPADLAGPALGLLASLLGVIPGLDAELARALLAGPVLPHTFPVFGLGLATTSCTGPAGPRGAGATSVARPSTWRVWTSKALAISAASPLGGRARAPSPRRSRAADRTRRVSRRRAAQSDPGGCR